MVGEENLQELVHGVEKRTALLQKEEEVVRARVSKKKDAP